MALQVAAAFGDGHQFAGDAGIDAGFMRDDLGFDGVFGIGEIEAAKALFGGLLQVLHQALIAGVVADDDLEIGVGMHQFALLLQRQHATVVGQRVDHHGGVLARFDDFVEVADGAVAGGNGQRAILPFGALGAEQEAADQIGGGHVLVTRHGDQRFAQLVSHVFDETGLAAAGRAFQHHRHAHRVGGFVQFDLVGDGAVIGFVGDAILIDDVAHAETSIKG